MKQLSYRSASRQRGFAMIAILALAALMSAYLIAAALNPDAAGQVLDRERRNMNALRQAKAALIAYAASEQWQKYKVEASNQPGALPCPDGDNNGDSDGICSNALSRIGRLPYKTIGSPDLTDASGERLWYAVSSNFYKNSAIAINSDTPGLLTVTGTAPVTDVVAIVFAPGPPIQDPLLPGQTQNRGGVNVTRPASYLEGFTPTSPDYTFATNALPSNTLNDRLLTITQAELMAVVEPVVATRIQRDIRPYIRNYLSSTGWTGRYPFAVAWGAGPSMSQNDYKGDASPPTYEGLMPVSRQAGWVQWNTASISVTQLPGGTGVYAGGTPPAITWNCSASTGAQISCQVDYPGGNNDRPEIRLQGTLLNAAKTFVNSPTETVLDFWGSVQGWSSTRSPNPFTYTRALAADGDGVILIEGRLVNAQYSGNRATILVPAPAYHAISNLADPTSGWFIANQWFQQTYYAVSTGGGVSCVIGTSCLTVNNLDTGTITNGRLILVFSGRTLNGPTVRTGALAQYLELENATLGNRIFQHHRFGMPTTINDQVVVVLP